MFVFREMFRRRSFRQLLKSGVIVISVGTVGFCGLEILYGSEKFYRNCIMSAVQALFDAESAHKLAVKMFANKLIPPFGQNYREYPILQTTVWGIEFRNPVGIAAGFDKDAVALPGLISSGFGFAEIGTVTPLAQEGNTKPRVFRLKEDLAVINSYGFNSEGHEAVFTRLETFLKTLDDFTVKIGVNLGKNKTSPNATEDFVAGVKKFGSFCDYLVINVSSPNTPGLRDLQHKRELENLLTAVNKARSELNHPTVMLLKVSPDLTNEERADIANVCTDKRFNVNGLIVSNTTIARPDNLISSNKQYNGGLSGKPLRQPSTDAIRDFYKLTRGQIPIVGCGGISSGEDAYEKIKAGASLVQLYTALVYDGFPIIGRVKRELTQCLERDGYDNISQAVGADSKS